METTDAMPKFSIVGVFCEDVRMESNGQITVIGILPDTIAVRGIPGKFARLGVFIRSHFEMGFELEELKFEIVDTDGEIAHTIDVESETIMTGYSQAKSGNHPVIGFNSVHLATPLQIKQPGQLQLVAMVNGERQICGALNVRLEKQEEQDEPKS
jgi:Family of unknown function (DUF6941)